MSIIIKDLCAIYQPKSPFSHTALDDVSLDINNGEFVAIIGETGSGKSTLVQQLNGLLLPTFGSIKVEKVDNENNSKTVVFELNRPKIYNKKNKLKFYKNKKIKNVKSLRKTVGLVFQFPEYQLFENDVITDVSYGPKNFGLTKEEAIEKSKKALSLVNIDESYYQRSPFELSGGEKRKVAIAGVLATEPDYLVLDEPTAGLDPVAETNMMNLFKEINQNGTTVILVSHNMDLVLKYATRCIVLSNGQIISDDIPTKVFTNQEVLDKTCIDKPKVIEVCEKLIENGIDIDIDKVTDVVSLVKEIRRVK